MSDDWWRQWQAFAAAFTPAGAAGLSHGAPQGLPGFAPFVEAGERFAAAVRGLLSGAAAGAAGQGAGAAAAAFAEFLRDQFAELKMPWSFATGADPGPSAAADATHDAPALGATREHQQRWQRMAAAWQRSQDAERRLQRLWGDALREAATAFAGELTPPPDVTKPEALQGLYHRWIDRAEEAYARTARSEAFCQALADFVNAGADWRREMQASLEHGAKLFDLPTRAEINTLTQRVKTLEAQLGAARAQSKPAKPGPSSKTGQKGATAKPKAAPRAAGRARRKTKS